MPRLFYGNFDFEESLIRPSGQQRSKAVQRILAELATTWVAVAERDDFIWCPRPVDAAFSARLEAAGWPRLRLVSRREDIPAGCEFVPWGWTEEAMTFGESVGATIDAPPIDSVRAVNSRQFSFEREQSLGVALPEGAVVTTVAEVIDAVELLALLNKRWLIKAEFSQAGREQFVSPRTTPFDREALLAWATPRLSGGLRLYIEPWLGAVAEVGVQLDITAKGDVRLVGVAEMLPSGRGGYAGSRLTPPIDDIVDWQPAIDAAMCVGREASRRGYFGPLGIDAMRYRDPDGSLHLRPLQDVNARWTMGRLSLGLHRFVDPDSEAIWVHSTRLEDWQAEVPCLDRRFLETSPILIDGVPVTHRHAVVIDTSDGGGETGSAVDGRRCLPANDQA